MKEKFCNEEEAVVEVAKSREAPMMLASRPVAKVEVAVEVATNAPAVNGRYDRALLRVMVPPSETAPPPESPEPAVTVTEEFWRKAFVIEPAGKLTEEVAVNEPTTKLPEVVEANEAN